MMPPWSFWTKGRALDLSADDMATVDGAEVIDEAQLRRIETAALAAKHRMIALPCGVPIGHSPIDHLSLRLS